MIYVRCLFIIGILLMTIWMILLTRGKNNKGIKKVYGLIEATILCPKCCNFLAKKDDGNAIFCFNEKCINYKKYYYLPKVELIEMENLGDNNV